MNNKNESIPNVFPIGVLRQIEEDDLIIAKIDYEAKLTRKGIENIIKKERKNE